MTESQSKLQAFDELERTRLEGLVRADIPLSEALHADDYQLITPGGAAMTKQQYLDAVASGELRYQVFEPASAVSVRESGDLAVVRYLARIECDYTGGHDSGLFWHTDMYERRDGQWRVVWSQATRTSR